MRSGLTHTRAPRPHSLAAARAVQAWRELTDAARQQGAQVGRADYDERSRRECRVFLRMLERLYPLADDVPARFTVRSFPHDFGAYREVCVRYDDTDARACDHARPARSLWPGI